MLSNVYIYIDKFIYIYIYLRVYIYINVEKNMMKSTVFPVPSPQSRPRQPVWIARYLPSLALMPPSRVQWRLKRNRIWERCIYRGPIYIYIYLLYMLYVYIYIYISVYRGAEHRTAL